MAWGAGKQWTPGYASPVAATVNGKRRVFGFTGGESRPSAGGLLCIDPATGKVDFTYPHRGRSYESVNASAPLILGNQVFISECYGAGGTLLDVQADGTAKEAWNSRALGTHFMTAIQKDGYLYGIDGHGPQNAPLVCVDLKTGKEMWRNEPEWEDTVKTADGPHKYRLSPGLASLILVNGRCLMLSEYGHLVWLDLNAKEYREVDRTRLFLARETWTPPALSHGLLYVCQNEKGVADDTPARIICYDLRGEK
jgi:outer membrane protein assembly factor BamB